MGRPGFGRRPTRPRPRAARWIVRGAPLWRSEWVRHVLTAGCDTLPVPMLPFEGLEAAVVAGHYLFGVWPVALTRQLDAHLATTQDRSMRHWIAVSGARQIAVSSALHNLNTQADFRHYAQTQGLAA